MNIADLLQHNPVVPVVVIHAVEHAVPLAEALLEGGINIIEVTLRTPEAAAAMASITKACPDMTLGAGTVIDVASAQLASDHGAQFAVSPGATSAVIEACQANNLPLLPGAQTVSEMMHLRHQGFHHLKFFPASAIGGRKFLSALQTVLPDMQFCPTGGITADTASDWLALDNVISVGGSWLCPPSCLVAGDFAPVTCAAKQITNVMRAGQ